jgi:hypothetical protein
MNFIKTGLLLLGLLTSLVSIAQKSSKFKVDANAKKYISKADKFKANAIYLQPQDLLVNKAITLGFQRRLSGFYWVDVAVTKSYKTLSVDMQNDVLASGFLSSLKYVKYKGKGLTSEATEMEGVNTAKIKMGLQASFNYNMVGIPPHNSLSYLLLVKFAAYDVNYTYYYINNRTLLTDNTFTKLSLMPGFTYKSSISNNIGYDVVFAGGVSMVKFGTSKTAGDVLSGAKRTILDATVQFKLYYTF